jgi:hypothetical protein
MAAGGLKQSALRCWWAARKAQKKQGGGDSRQQALHIVLVMSVEEE